MARLNKFKVNAKESELLSRMAELLMSELESTQTSYQVVGKEDEQAHDYRTGELLWEDEEHTIPKYRDKWGNVPKRPEDITPEDEITIAACNNLLAKLEKLM